MIQDIRVALRSLGKSPAFAAVVVLTLALGIGAITSVFSVVNGALLSALPFDEPERLVILRGSWREGTDATPSQTSYGDFLAYRDHGDALAAMAAFSEEPRDFVLNLGSVNEQIKGEFVSANYFDILGIRAAEGRLFAAEEDQLPDGSRVAILGYDAWKSTFGGDLSILGKTILLSENGFQVVGIAPRGFKGISDQADLFLPVTTAATFYGRSILDNRAFRWLSSLGRLREGASIEQAASEMKAAAASLGKNFPDTNEKAEVVAETLVNALQGSLRKGLLTLLFAAAFVLLIGCVNIANLLLTRAMARQGEISVRAALGASRHQLIRQVLAESLVLAAFGCAFGLLLAVWSTKLLVNASGVEFRDSVALGLDPKVVAAALIASVFAGLGFGLLPALSAARVNLNETLKEGGKTSASRGRQRLQGALVVAEVALALLLFVSAGLMIRSFVNLQQADLGFRPGNLLTMRIDVKGKRYQGITAQANLTTELLERLRSMAGVKSVALSSPDLPTDDFTSTYILLEEREDSVVNEELALEFHRVSPDYFSTLGIPMTHGLAITASDNFTNQRVAITSNSILDRYWAGDRGVGRKLRLAKVSTAASTMTVKGIAGDVLHEGLKEDGRKHQDVYLPILQYGFDSGGLVNFLVRVEPGIDPASLANEVRQEIQSVVDGLPVFDVATLDERLNRQVAHDRFLVLLMSLFAFMALLLAAVGIYGVISYAVTQRTKEIGVRMALGADRGQVLKLIVRRGVMLAVSGVVLGLASSLALTRLLRGLLYGIGTLDPATLASTALFLILVATIASYIPARKATKIEPTVTLRAD